MLIRDQIRDEAVQRMSMHQEYADDRDWIEAVRQVVRDEVDFQEGKRLQENNFSGSTSAKCKNHSWSPKGGYGPPGPPGPPCSTLVQILG